MLFALHGRLVTPMHVKLRSADEHQGPFGCAKYFLNRRKNYQKFPLFGKESPSTGEPLYRLTSKFLTAFIRPTARIKFTDRPKIRLFAPQGELVAPMHVKLYGADENLGPLGCAKFCLNRCKDVGMGPKNIKNFDGFHTSNCPY